MRLNVNRRTIVAPKYAVKPLFMGVHSSQRDNYFYHSYPENAAAFSGFCI